MKFSTRIILLVLSLLGFSSCQDKPLAMYGEPTADFRLCAKVVDKMTQKPIKDILVKIVVDGHYYRPPLFQTDDSGFFFAGLSVVPMDQKIKVIWQDIDGAANGGTYVKDSLEFQIKNQDFKGGDGEWHSGSQTKEMILSLDKEAL